MVFHYIQIISKYQYIPRLVPPNLLLTQVTVQLSSNNPEHLEFLHQKLVFLILDTTSLLLLKYYGKPLTILIPVLILGPCLLI